ncbi:hypothetical protein M441DRAFT_398401 [Trichoderma asperellum CBS 433.97]|uniref:Uncharacterized protein n=1 Tax=Trichoderma asperellum (strain ATCC 204424 / CBS 433.97 / NBRC 101777) TaxID=1042311 RepID=A0A2T3Z9E6_TRIA4|nr:hypothetical protein M441DRAFT_398401 [Trichoderma asperellum CBS 433.97]PTB41434.1 hypothetical protein M441DRAFT_398401 [Trichoderma asperellum CBS 433.97]
MAERLTTIKYIRRLQVRPLSRSQVQSPSVKEDVISFFPFYILLPFVAFSRLCPVEYHSQAAFRLFPHLFSFFFFLSST